MMCYYLNVQFQGQRVKKRAVSKRFSLKISITDVAYCRPSSEQTYEYSHGIKDDFHVRMRL